MLRGQGACIAIMFDRLEPLIAVARARGVWNIGKIFIDGAEALAIIDLSKSVCIPGVTVNKGTQEICLVGHSTKRVEDKCGLVCRSVDIKVLGAPILIVSVSNGPE